MQPEFRNGLLPTDTAPQTGEVAVWGRMSAIECNCVLEATLDKCVAKVQSQVSGVFAFFYACGRPRHF